MSSSNILSDGWTEDDIGTAVPWTAASIEAELMKPAKDRREFLDKLLNNIDAGGAKVTKAQALQAALLSPDKDQRKEIYDIIKKMKNPRRKKGMAKKRRKSKGSKVGHKKRRKGAKVSYKKRRKSRKSAKIAAAMVAEAGHKKRRKGKKRRGHKRSHKRRNPIGGGMMKELATIAAAGAAASLAVGLVSKFAKPVFDKLPSAITGLKVGNVAVGQLAISALVPAALYVAMKKSRMPFLDKAADVLAVVTAANIGGRLASAVLPGGMIAGVEPQLMGVEPQLMGNSDFGYGSSDFGDSDFGDSDFGEILMSGVEPQLMGSSDFGGADFGAIEQFSGHDAASLGAVQMYAGDEDYAGEDLDGDDFDGDSDFGLG